MIRAGSMSIILPLIERLGRGAGRLLVGVSTFVVVFLLLAGWRAGNMAGGTWLPFIVGIVAAIPVALFAWRRRRLEAGVKATQARLSNSAPASGGAGQLVVRDDAEAALTEERKHAIARERSQKAMAESAQLRQTYLPRIEAAQRAAIAMAGGVDNAPYLKDDVRVTLIALVGTIIAVPVSVIFLITALFLIL
ncbi:hypothetical protein J2S49_001778 [Arcanobacterium wilhelmae]|uniref:Uncharacterized protein n=1 Tax=Arcanobacterium wilhelmae TaxID=1803177 RepID=A0ABT9NDA6_9ACTO|nr:hypothetical protein [Arcanobacterium wilhelmae]MDP9801702.1 hypothetical protein [Arcanobacterium wilhelmae]WFN91022.1 hypothetical protein P8A24_03990 [Arcanobacterium wilhelmae]